MNEVVKVQVSHKNVYVALAAAQMQMDPVTKGALNPAFKGEGKTKGTAYADLADVVQAVRHALNSHGLAFFHQLIPGEQLHIMRTVLMHGESETHIDCDVPLIVAANNMQGMKSATTYAKRIGLESVTGVAPEDDDGNAAVKAAPVAEKGRDPVRTDQTAVQIAKDSLSQAETLPALAAIWGDLPLSVKGEKPVFDAKEARKSTLSKPVNADIGGDEIPY